jgi:hypothetical protein
MKKKLESRIFFLKYFQLIGAIIGFLVTIYFISILNFDNVKHIELVTLFMMILFFGFNFYSYFLFYRKKHELGLKWTSFLLLMQLISITIDGFFYSAVNLIGINLKLDLTQDSIIGLDFQISHFITVFSFDKTVFLIKINLVAIFLLFYLSNIYQELKIMKNNS